MISILRFAAPVLLISACVLFSGLVAQDDKPSPEKKADVPAEKKKAPSLDEELLKSLDPNAEKDETDVDRLERAIKGMRAAQQRIESQDTGKQTRETQEQVVRDLDKLIELIRQQLQQAQQKQSQKQKQEKDKGKQKPLASVELDPQNSQKQQQKQGEQKTSQNGTDKSKQSTNRTAADKAREEEAARREKLVKDVWGHLPPALREELNNAYKENFLPKYEDQVRKYYESLAEKNKKNKARPR